MQNPKKLEDILQLIAVVLLLVLLNIHATKFFFRLDLTEEKRYTIADASKKILNSLDDQVYVEVYLDGELNAGFKRLQKAIKETLEEFQIYGGDNVQYKFVNPDAATSEQERTAFYKQLVNKGLQPTNLYETVNGQRKEKLIFPAALITYKNRETPVLLLKGSSAVTPQEQLNQSVENVEFELVSAIKKLSAKQKPSIAIIEGHDELRPQDIGDLTATLDEFYVTERINLQHSNLQGYDAVLIAQPKKRYTELDKYKIDQFIMRGGKALFFLDAIQMNLDSIGIGGAYAFGYDLNLNDMLFKYGVRINQDLIQDTEMGKIVINVGSFGNRPNLQGLPFPYYVLINSFKKMPITKNLNSVQTKFVSSIDTVKAEGKVTKTPLMRSNQYSFVRPMPNIVSLDEVRNDDVRRYNKRFVPVAYLLEGQFASVFKNRFAPDSADNKTVLQQSSKPTQILVCSDGDLPRNEIDRRTNKPLPLGYEPLSQQTYSNKDFILNTLAYMLDHDGLITARAKEVTLRPLDKIKIREDKLYWQILNIALPLLVVALFGGFRFWWRKKQYAKYTNVQN